MNQDRTWPVSMVTGVTLPWAKPLVQLNNSVCVPECFMSRTAWQVKAVPDDMLNIEAIR